MTLTLTTIIAVLVAHFVADFIFQNDAEAKNKSKCNKALLKHVAKYTLVFSILYTYYAFLHLAPKVGFSFFLLTGILHFITDYITSRINSRLWAAGDMHNFFVGIGADQLIHYITLFGTLLLFIP